MAQVTGLYRLGLQVPDLDKVAGFYLNNWRMVAEGSQGNERLFRTKATDHADLVLRKGDAAKLDHIALRVASESELYELVDAVERAGFPVAAQPGKGRLPGEALAAAVNDPDGNRIELVVPSAASERWDADNSEIGPKYLGHVVLWTPRPEKQEAFYALLGLRVSDRTHVGMSFLRCNTDHHTLAFVRNSRERVGLQHAAFDVGSVDAVMRSFARLRDEGVTCIWGVGRHGPGNNVFSYYTDPAHNIVEYYGDMEKVEVSDELDVRFWGPEHKGDVWGIAGPPPAAFRD